MNLFRNSIVVKLYKELSSTSLAIFLFFIISMIMQNTVSRFEKESYFSSVQFGFNPEPAIFMEERRVLFGDFAYEWWFFIPDMFFMLSICWIVAIIYKKIKSSREKRYISYGFFKWALIISGVLSIVFDWYENVQYLGGLDAVPMYWPGVDMWKETAIAVLFVLTIIYCILHFYDTGTKGFVHEDPSRSLNWEPEKMLVVFRGAAISILVLAVIGLGLTLLDQGATLVVHLLDQADTWHGALQIVMTVLLINLLAVIISHYPEYLQNAIEPSKKIRWNINWVFNKIPGLITFTSIHHDDPESYAPKNYASLQNRSVETDSKYTNYVTLFRYYLGVMTYVAWFYVMYKAFDLYSLTKYDAWASVTLWSMFVCVIIYYLYRAHSKDSHGLVNEIVSMMRLDPSIAKSVEINKNSIDKVRPWVNGYKFFLVLTILLAVVAMYIFAEYGWHLYSFYTTIAFLLSNTFLYVFFRFTRLYIKFVWFDSNYVKYLLVKDNELAFIGDSNISLILDNDKSNSFFRKLVGRVSSNYYFLYYMRIVATLSSVYLMWSFFTMGSYITCFSAIPLTLSFLMIIYIVIIYPIKFYMAYGSRQYNEHGDENQDGYYIRKRKYLWAMFSVALFLFVANTLGNVDNLHKLFYVKSEKHESIEEFSSNLIDYIDEEMVVNDSIVTPMLQITSFGGGLKSNLWTLLTMDALDDQINEQQQGRNYKINNSRFKGHRILDYTISLSGVSGGAVGLGNYLVLDYMNRTIGPDAYNRDEVIQNIGRENILAIDVAGVFGHDRIKGTMNFGASSEKPNYDRSFYAMQRYMKVLSKTENTADIDSLANSSISEYWKKMKTGVKHNPALIINTASTGFQPGVALSLDYNSLIFPGYIHLSDEEESKDGTRIPKDLRYYDAVSTSNRFPIMSPAGQIENEGFFLDGGYFENSGLMTTKHLYNDLKTRSHLIEKYPIGTLVILNGKTDYVRRFIDLHNIKQTEINESTNSAAIIAGITNIDKLPNVLLETEQTYKDKGDSLFTIYMPHPISIDDIYAALGGEFIISEDKFKAIEENNEAVLQALDDYNIKREMTGVVVPPLARTLSQPAVDYETAMVNHHPEVKDQMDKVISFIKNGVYIEPSSIQEVSVDTTAAPYMQEFKRVIRRIINARNKEIEKDTEDKIDATSVVKSYENKLKKIESELNKKKKVD